MRYSKKDQAGAPTQIPIEVLCLDKDKKETNLGDIRLVIRELGGKYWDGSAFVVALTLIPMPLVDSVNSPGERRYILDTTNLPSNTFSYKADDITTPTKLAANMPQVGSDQFEDGMAHQVKLAASAASGKAVYDPGSSVESLSEWADPSDIVAESDMKDIAGAPAGQNDFYEKVPK